MPTFQSQKMKQTAEDNEKYLKDTRQLLKQRRESGDMQHYGKKNKEEAKKFSLFRFLTRKNDRIGRFGAVRAAENEDVIKQMDGRDDLSGKSAYFDPFSLMVIEPASIKYFGTEDADKLEEDRLQAEGIGMAFAERVGEEIDNVRSNDFEASRNTLDARLAFAQNEEKDEDGVAHSPIDTYAVKYDPGRRFVPDDEVMEEIPEEFQVEIGVDDPPEDHALEWEMYKADQTKSIGARFKGFFRSILRIKAPEETTMFRTFAKTLPEYKRLENEGREYARQAGMNYKPDLDNELNAYVSSLYSKLRKLQNGHSYVKLIANKSGKEISAYSFRFVTLQGVITGMDGVVTGMVDNPIRKKTERVATKEKITYPNYLRAAARIRGIAGSMRTYSYLGYNCTSFAAEIAETAGVKFKKEDTSAILMSHRHRQQRVDNPFRMAAYVKERERIASEEAEKNESYAESQMSDEKHIQNLIVVKRGTYKNQYRKNFMDLEIVKLIKKYRLVRYEVINDRLNSFIDSLVAQSIMIDERIPLNGRTDAEVQNALEKRQDAKIRAFGKKSIEEVLDNLVDPTNEDRIARFVLGDNYRIAAFLNSILNKLPSMENYDDVRLVRALANSEYVIKNYPDRTSFQRSDIARDIVWSVVKRQREDLLRIWNQVKDLSGRALVRGIETGLNGVDLLYYRPGVFESAGTIQDAMEKMNIPLPLDEVELRRRAQKSDEELEEERAKEKEKEEQRQIEIAKKQQEMAKIKDTIDVSEVPDKVPNSNIRKWFKTNMADAFNGIFQAFLDTYAGPVGIEGYSGRYRKRIDTLYDIAEFVVECNRKPVVQNDIRECYIKAAKTNDYEEAVRLIKEMFEKILKKLSKDELKVVFANSYIS